MFFISISSPLEAHIVLAVKVVLRRLKEIPYGWYAELKTEYYP